MNFKNILSACLIFCLLFFGSCKKYLETKSLQTLSTPSTLADLQLLLDNISMVNTLGLAYSSTDEFYMNYTEWQNRPEAKKLSYIWDASLNDLPDWNIPYNTVYYANNVLLNLESIDSKGQEEKKNNIKGAALFYRAYSFYQLLQFYAPQYEASSATSDLGIVLRLDADFNVPSVRSTVQNSYDQVIKDLKEALSLLQNTSISKNRPSKAGCYALLSKTYLQTGNYSKAKENADACLQLYSTLLDYNSLLPISAFFPFSFNNNEVIFYSKTEAPLNLDYTRAKVDTNLLSLYASNDIRKQAFFKVNSNGSYAFRGNYTGEDFVLFNGLATDEVYLIRAECYAREGNIASALQDLNTLLQKRWLTGTFTPFTATTADQALFLILQERRKELVNRGTRWSDLRRLNKDSRFAITLRRILNGQTYSLPPNDLRYTLLIPLEVMNVTNLQQNPR
jgi:hypothetical protein